MRVRLAVAELVNSVFVNGQANVASSVHRISMDILFTTFCKLPLIHSEPLPRSRSKKKRRHNSLQGTPLPHDAVTYGF